MSLSKNLFFTLAVGLAVLLFGVLIKSAFADTSTPVSEQVAKAESETTSALPAPVEEAPLSPADRHTEAQTLSSSSASDESQPTTQLKSQVANGIKFTLSNYSRVANHFFVDVCYDLPGPGVWDINGATLLYGPLRTSSLEFKETSLQVATEVGQLGQRCATLDFNQITTSETSKTFTLIIEWLGLTEPPVNEGEECAVYLARGEAALAQYGIALKCDSGPGYFGLAIANKPDRMTQAEAEDLLAKIVYGRIEGPWTFNGTVEN